MIHAVATPQPAKSDSTDSSLNNPGSTHAMIDFLHVRRGG
jgi:hypothetical protein